MRQGPGIIGIVLTIWVTIWLGLWFFGIRDAIWPPWPWKTQCQQIEERHADVLFDPEGPDTIAGPGFAMKELEREGCIQLTD